MTAWVLIFYIGWSNPVRPATVSGISSQAACEKLAAAIGAKQKMHGYSCYEYEAAK